MRIHLVHRVQVALVAAMVVPASCADRQPKDFLEMELAQPGTDQLTFAELPVQSCMPGVVTAYADTEDPWRVHLDEERGGIEVAVLITSPSGELLQGVLDEAVKLTPGFSGSGTSEVRPEGDPNADPSTAQLAWLCD